MKTLDVRVDTIDLVPDMSTAGAKAYVTSDQQKNVSDFASVEEKMLLGVAVYSLVCLCFLLIVQRRNKEKPYLEGFDGEKSELVGQTSSGEIDTVMKYDSIKGSIFASTKGRSKLEHNNILQQGVTGIKHLSRSQSFTGLISLDYETIKLLKLTKSLAARAAINPAIDLLLSATITSQMGDGAVQAYLTSKMVVSLTSFACDGIIGAQYTFVSKLVGDKNFYLAGRFVHVATLAGIIIFSMLFPLWYFFMDDILQSIFGFDAAVARMGLEYTRVYGIAHILILSQQVYASILDVNGHEDFNTLIYASKGVVLLSATVALGYFMKVQLYMIGLLELLFGLLFFAIHVVYPFKKRWICPYWNGVITLWTNADMETTKVLLSNGFLVSIASTVAHFEWQILSFFAASAGANEVAAWFLIGTIWEFVAALSVGISEACQIRVAKHLGRGNPERAKQSALRSIHIVGFLTAVGATIGLLLRGAISKCFADDATIVELMYNTLPIILLGTVAEGFGYVAYYTIKGQGRFRIMTVTETGQCLLVTIPLAALMVFVLGCGVQGIASSLMIGYLTSGTVLLSFVLTSDWDKIAKEYSPEEESSSHWISSCEKENSGTMSLSSLSSSGYNMVDFLMP